MKNIFVVSAIAVSVSLLSFYGLFTYLGYNIRVGYINSQEVVAAFPQYKEAQVKLLNAYEIQKKRVDSVSQLYYAKLANIDTTSLNEFEQKELQGLVLQIQGMQQQAEESLRLQDTRISAGVSNQLDQAIAEFAKEHSYDIILGTMAEGSIVYGAPVADLTEEMIDYLNNRQK